MASGQFVWFDLITTDVQAAKAFYTDLIGWQTTQWSGGEYEMWTVAEQRIGGVMRRRDGDSAPPRWMGYIATEQVEAVVQKATARAGRLIVPVTDIPEVGRFAVLADPQGAVFALFQPMREERMPDRRMLGHFAWAELNTTDWKAAWKFYTELFGWKHTNSVEMGPQLGEYFMFGTEPKDSLGGMSNSANLIKTPAHWLHYVNVKDADATAKRVAAQGGKVLNGPMEVPGGGRIAQCLDPQGAAFAIFAAGR